MVVLAKSFPEPRLGLPTSCHLGIYQEFVMGMCSKHTKLGKRRSSWSYFDTHPFVRVVLLFTLWAEPFWLLNKSSDMGPVHLGSEFVFMFIGSAFGETPLKGVHHPMHFLKLQLVLGPWCLSQRETHKMPVFIPGFLENQLKKCNPPTTRSPTNTPNQCFLDSWDFGHG